MSRSTSDTLTPAQLAPHDRCALGQRPRQAERLCVPARVDGLEGRADLDRSRPPNLDLSILEGLGDKTVIFGVISMGDPQPETPETVAARIRAALAHIPPEQLIPAPDCGMKYIPRETAFATLKAT